MASAIVDREGVSGLPGQNRLSADPVATCPKTDQGGAGRTVEGLGKSDQSLRSERVAWLIGRLGVVYQHGIARFGQTLSKSDRLSQARSGVLPRISLKRGAHERECGNLDLGIEGQGHISAARGGVRAHANPNEGSPLSTLADVGTGWLDVSSHEAGIALGRVDSPEEDYIGAVPEF